MRTGLLASAAALLIGALAAPSVLGDEPSLDGGPWPTALAAAAGHATIPVPGVATDPGSATPTPMAPLAAANVALVPVVDRWSPRERISMDALARAMAGQHPAFDRVLVAAADLDAVTARLGVRPGSGTRAASAGDVRRAVAGHERVLGLVPAGAVRPDVRALAIDDARLFGAGRVTSLDAWPLVVPEAVAGSPDTFDPGSTWTLVAGGDVMLDREVHRQAVILRRGPDHPWRGGIARIVSRTCCTRGEPTIVAQRVRDPGAVGDLLGAADLAIVNHEGPAPDDHRYHPGGFTFTFDPSLLPGLHRAGIDLVSLANNHIRNAGSGGVIDTIRNLREAGIRSVGAGRDRAAAREGACFDVRGLRACVLAYDDVDVARNAATARRPGAAPLRARDLRRDVSRLRREGADAVIVVPHWGQEYVDRPVASQRRMAAVAARAGVDLVLGAHSHVVGAVERVRGMPVVFSMGDLLFDLTRFERTMEGVLVEATFVGGRVAQFELHPTVLIDRSQVGLLRPRGDGRVVIERMRRAST